jgi:hypothetical protein
MLTFSLGQLPAKWMFVRALQGTADLTKNTVKHWVYWLGSVFIVVVCGYILASAVPVFSGLLGVIGSLFCAFLCITVSCARLSPVMHQTHAALCDFQLMGFMWMYDHWDERKVNKSWKYRLLFAFNVFQIVGGIFIMVAGVSSLSHLLF